MAAVATIAAKQAVVVLTTAVPTTAVAIAAAVVVAAPQLRLLLLTKRLQFLQRRLPIQMLGSPNRARWSVPALFAKQEYLARAFPRVGQLGRPR